LYKAPAPPRLPRHGLGVLEDEGGIEGIPKGLPPKDLADYSVVDLVICHGATSS